MTDSPVVTVGTRGSALALAQASLVASALDARGIDHELAIIETAGDKRAPDTAWGDGAFVSAIERALFEGRVDAAVHSAKDLPTDEDPRLVIAAFLKREEPRDAFVLPEGRLGSLESLPAGSTIGTDSPRRTGFLRTHRGDLDVRPLHGNVDTRLRRLDEGKVDAIVIAAAGLIRLGRADRISELLPVTLVPPAPGQGAIAIQVRADDFETRDMLAGLDDPDTRTAVEAERAFLHATGGGCRAPIGSLATVSAGFIEITGGFATIDGRAAGLETVAGAVADWQSLAEGLARRVVTSRGHLPGAPRVMITRPDADSMTLAARLAEHGITAVIVPAIAIEPLDARSEVTKVLAELDSFDWAIATSANAVRSVAHTAHRDGSRLSAIQWAAVGNATARELRRVGVQDVWLPSRADAEALGAELPVRPGQRAVWFCGDLADRGLSVGLEERGVRLTSLAVYRTTVGPESSRGRLTEALSQGPIDAVVLASPSAARGLSALAARNNNELLSLPAICVGERTAHAARGLGLRVVAVAPSPDASVVAELVANTVRPRTPETVGATQ